MGKSKVTIGYKYLMGILMGVNYGEVDEFTEIRVGEREAWKGSVTGNTTINIDKPDLFGGDESEGGIQGSLDFMFGAADQPVNPKLASMFGHAVSAFRRRTTVFFDGMVCALSKYPKPWSLRRNRRLKGWDGGVWYAAKVAIDLPGIKAMNPAHIIYQLLTDRFQGRGFPRSRLDDAAFRAAADIFHAEQFGLCIKFTQQGSIEEKIQVVQDHVGANVFLHRVTGLWTIRAVRGNYDVNTLPLFDYNTGLISILEDDNSSNSNATNEVVVEYFDVIKKIKGSVKVQNDAAIFSANGTFKFNSETSSYPGIPTAGIALRVAQRDLRAKFGVKRFKVILDRRGYQVEPGGVFRISAPTSGIVNLVLRAARIDDGQIADGKISIDAVLDVFGLPANSYTDVQPPLWTPPSVVPEVVTTRRIMEATHRDVVRSIDDSSLTPGSNLLVALGAAPQGLALGFQLDTRVGTGDWESYKDGVFCPTGKITAPIPQGAEPVAIELTESSGIEAVTVGSAALINNEIFRVTAVNPFLKTATLARGCIDTVPTAHALGDRVWFYEDFVGVSQVEYANTVTVQAKMLTRTVADILDADAAPTDNYVMARRRERPYPPGNIRLNSLAYPQKITGALTVGFSNRNRITQADQLIDTTVTNVYPEAGATQRIKISGDGMLLADVTLSENDSIHALSIDDEKLGGLTHLPHNFTIRGTGLEAINTAESQRIYQLDGIDFFITQYAKVDGGWLTLTSLGSARGIFVDSATATKTITPCDIKAQTRVQKVTLVTGVPKIDSYLATTIFKDFTGWASYWFDPNNVDNGFVSDQVALFRQPPFKDRRSNPTHVVVSNYAFTSLQVSAQKFVDARQLDFIEYSLHVAKKAAVLAGGSMATERTTIEGYWLSTANQFDAITGIADPVPLYMPLDSLLSAHNAHDLVYETGVIFGSVLYVHYHRGTGAGTTAGKAFDITNVVSSGHISYKTGVELCTKTYNITTDGVLTPINTRAGFYIADQLNATQGIEILYSTRQVWLVNSTTGAQGALLGVLDFDPCAVYGDTTNEWIYIFGVDGTLRKYNSSLTLLASVYVGSTDRFNAWKLRRSNIKEGAAYIYVQFAGKTFLVTKDFARAEPVNNFEQTFPGYASPTSNIVMMHHWVAAYTGTGLVDEAGIASSVFNQPRPRVAGNLTVEVNSTRDFLPSTQKHVISTKRVGYGLRYGFNYRW